MYKRVGDWSDETWEMIENLRKNAIKKEPEPEPVYECEKCQDQTAYPIYVNGKRYLTQCECVEWKKKRKRVNECKGRLKYEFGDFEAYTFESFDLERVLEGSVAWGGVDLHVEEQRMMLNIAVEQCQAYAFKEPMSGFLWLAGPIGSGKTHLAAAVAQAATEKPLEVRFILATKLIGWIRSGFENHEVQDRIDEMGQAEFLWIDDIGVGRMTEWTEEVLMAILDERMRHKMPTMFTSNMRIQDMPGRLASRIIGYAEQAWVVASDYRWMRNRGKNMGGDHE